MDFTDSFLLLLLVGFSSATVHPPMVDRDIKLPYKLCLNEDSDHCTVGSFSPNSCMNMSLEIDVDETTYLRLVSEGKTYFATIRSDAQLLQGYVNTMFCGKPALPLILETISHNYGTDVWLKVDDSTRISIWNLTGDSDPEEATGKFEVQCGRLETVNVNVKEDWDVNRVDDDKLTALAWAVMFGDIETVKQLLAKGADPQIITQYHNTTIVHIAASSCNEDVLNYFIANGFNVSIAVDKGFTPLHVAARMGLSKIARILLTTYSENVNARDQSGRTAFLEASRFDNTDFLDVLISFGANAYAIDKNGYSALHHAAEHGGKHVIEMLINKGLPIDMRTHLRRTPLMLAAKRGKKDNVETLLALGADTKAVDSRNKSALDYAGSKRIAALLKAKVAKVNP